MNEIVKKLAGLGLPGVILVILTVTSGGSNAAVVAALTGVGGPFGIIGGIALLGLTSVLGDTLAGYGIEAILEAVYGERSKTESVGDLLEEIQDLPITEDLKLKLNNQLSPETTVVVVEKLPPLSSQQQELRRFEHVLSPNFFIVIALVLDYP